MNGAEEQVSLPNVIQGLSFALHDLCQPLTTLQCRLEMAEMLNTDRDYREAVKLGVNECARLSQCVLDLREQVRRLSDSLRGKELAAAAPVGLGAPGRILENP